MCLIALALGVSRRYPLVCAANRDERHARPADPLAWWSEAPRILGGRDLTAGGSWLAVDEQGRLAAVTNWWEPARDRARNLRSRGELVTSYLRSRRSATDFAAELQSELASYGPFNLLLLDDRELHYLSNRAAGATLPAGIHVLSNTRLDADWPKLSHARRGLAAALELDDPAEALFAVLETRDPQAGQAGNPADPESHKRALFIQGPEYGTRCSTVILRSADGELTFIERRFGPAGRPLGESRVVAALPGH